jgi:signal transduction histidine kinase
MFFEGREAGLEGGARDQEYFLAHACLVLGFACVLTSYLYPAVLGKHVILGRLLTYAYFAYGLLNLAVVQLGRHTGLVWRLSSHAADVILASLIIVMTGGAHSPFLPLYFFVLLAAASRWGVAGILPTVCVGIIVLLLDAGAPSSWSDAMPNWVGGSGYFNAIIALLVLSAYLFGLLMEKEKKQHADGVIITRLVRKTLHESSLRANIGNILKFVREHFNADQVRLVIQEIKGEQTFLWEVTRPTPNHQNEVKSWGLTGPEREACFATLPEEVWRLLGLRRVGGDPKLRAAAWAKREEDSQNPLRSALAQFVAPEHYYDELYDMRIVSEQHAPLGGFSSLLATSFSLEKRWFGRLTVYGPRNRGDSRDNSRFLATLVQEVGPVVFNRFLVGRLRSRAQTRERLRLAQELHDGVIQSLIGLEMQIDLLRRAQENSNGSAAPVGDLKRLQEVLHNEIANLREEMQRVRPLEVEPARLLDSMAGAVERFRRDLGISADFVAEAQEVSLPPRVCAQLVRIVQEALANVRKHSGAHKVQVAFVRENGHWKLCVEDDGRGFRFTGRLSSAELESVPECPLVIKERVRSIGGELMIESVPGSGAKLEILVPLSTNGRATNPN